MNAVLVLGTADWNQPIATNQHYVVRELARDFPLIYTESMGLRAPELTMRDLRRMARRLGIGAPSTRAVRRPIPEGVEVRSPKVLPRHVGLARRINEPRLHALVQDWIDQDGPRLLWTYTPVTYGLERIATDVVYHCVDLLGEVDGIPKDLIDASERTLSQRTVTAIGTSPVVVEHLRGQGFTEPMLWPNVADTAVIAAARPAEVRRVPRRAVFAGNLTTTKVDFDLLARLVRAGVDLHLAGPVAEGGGSAQAEVDALVRDGATYHGMLDPSRLAELYWTADVGLIPYLLNDYTRGVSPLKTYEYLAAGLGVVSTAVPSVRPVDAHVAVTVGAAEFVEDVMRSFGASDAARAERVLLADQHSWIGRGSMARELASGLLAQDAIS